MRLWSERTALTGLAADEALITASSIYVLPVVKIDSKPIGDGKAGPFTIALRKGYTR